MIALFLSFFTYFMIITFYSSQHPLFMSVMIALQSVLIGMMIYLFNCISWFSYLLFMIFLSGMMIILVYISSLASNLTVKYFFFDIKLLSLSMIIPMILIFSSNQINIFYNNNTNFSNLCNLIMITGKVYSSKTYLFTILIICYLLVVLILVVKNSLFTKGPLRTHL
uniref:NADH dehydrogenase subunit 6 n=1 Tax=Metacrangonyx goulmimensis TaxID=1199162 RepID=K7ZW35_9CRUS|nr:NADH dehydrogenase subunit 6 [Metacrangonyx goulmimensis]